MATYCITVNMILVQAYLITCFLLMFWGFRELYASCQHKGKLLIVEIKTWDGFEAVCTFNESTVHVLEVLRTLIMFALLTFLDLSIHQKQTYVHVSFVLSFLPL